MKRLLIAGIDPGTTLGCALLDLNGEVVRVNSSKQLDSSSLILEMIKEGRVIIIGVDKGKTPRFVEGIASKIGARIIKPKEDLLVEEKRELTKGYEFRNEHEKDAMASALYAYKKIRRLLTKIDFYLKKRGKESIAEEVKGAILKDKGLRIAEAVMMIEQPEEKKEGRRKRKRTGKMREEYFEEEIEEEPGHAERPEFLKQKINVIIRTKMRKIIRIKNQKIDFLTKKAREQEEEIGRLNEKLERFKELIKKSDKNMVLKKIKNLSWEEVEKEELSKIMYVEEPNIFSEKSVEKIREKVDVVISRKEMSKKVEEKFNVMFIDGNKVDVQEENGIVLVSKEKLEKEKSKVDVVKKVIEEYKESRKLN